MAASRSALILVLLFALGHAAQDADAAEELNPPQPVLAKRLEDKQTCIAVATDVGERVLALATKTDAGITIGEGPAVYSGDAGIALLMAGLHRATKEKKWFDATRALLDQAVATLPDDAGLYTGRAGIGQACLEAYHATGEKHFLKLARACVQGGKPSGATDIISGTAGQGVFLLNLHGATGEPLFLAEARKLGDALAASAVRNDGAAHWPIVTGGNPRVYLGFSHGAAGIGYFLLHLGRRTKHEPYLQLAREAAAFVLLHEDQEGEERAHWWRTVPKTSDYRRIQWCHGAPGIGFFFHDLARYLKQASYGEALERCLTTTQKRGRSARRSACQCHGVTGNAELFLEVFAAGGDAQWLREAQSSGSAIVEAHDSALRLASPAGAARYRPSYMLGLAGIGHFFLRLADPTHTPLPMMVRP